jgi:tetratricopeptide (TPR) repeat protein
MRARNPAAQRFLLRGLLLRAVCATCVTLAGAGCATPRHAPADAADPTQPDAADPTQPAGGGSTSAADREVRSLRDLARPPADGIAGQSGEPEAQSPRGRAYRALPSGRSAELEARLAEAQRELAEHPDDPERAVWVGRRLGYLWRMRQAIDVYTRGIEDHPRYAPLYRHRGHRYISIRRFDDAVRDLERAVQLIRGQRDEIEPDGAPNERDIPLTTTAFNVWYHLALAHYLKGDYEAALDAWLETLKHSYRHDDNLVATTYWLYLTLRKLGRHEAAKTRLNRVSPDMTIIENHAYHDLLLMFKQQRSVEQVRSRHTTGANAATVGYGVGMWRLFQDQREQAEAAFEQVTSGDDWPAFGFIAAEVELARLRPSPR